MINAYLKAAEYEGFGIFNIGSGKSFSVKEIVDKIIQVHGKDISVEFTNEKRKNETLDCYADINKAKELLNWQPTISFDQGLKKLF
jgi:UDP-glucose 4-epimerase